MAATVNTTTTNQNIALVPWADVMALIQQDGTEFTTQQPVLSIGGMGLVIGMGSAGGGLSFTWSITPQRLDEVLRGMIPALPTLGLYTVAVTANDTTNALSVAWTTTVQPAHA